jgi:hypothetical protein
MGMLRALGVRDRNSLSLTHPTRPSPRQNMRKRSAEGEGGPCLSPLERRWSYVSSLISLSAFATALGLVKRLSQPESPPKEQGEEGRAGTVNGGSTSPKTVCRHEVITVSIPMKVVRGDNPSALQRGHLLTNEGSSLGLSWTTNHLVDYPI